MDYFTSADGRDRVQLATHETSNALIDVADERVLQVAKWGVQTRPDGTGSPIYAEAARLAKERTDAGMADGTVTWLDIAFEEIFEAFAETDPAALRTELVQVAAVFTQWIEDIDRKDAAAPARVVQAAPWSNPDHDVAADIRAFVAQEELIWSQQGHRAPDLKTPEEWCIDLDVQVLDPDGWREDGQPWETPITEADFRKRLSISTIRLGAAR